MLTFLEQLTNFVITVLFIDLEELLDTARHEKEILEQKLTDAQENVALIENNLAKQMEQNENVEQQLVDSKNNAKTTVSEQYQ